MAGSNSFDIVSEVDLQEVDNAVNQTVKEISQRYDFKGSKVEVQLDKDEIKVHADDDFKLKSVHEILRGKFSKRGISVKALDYGKIEKSGGDTIKQVIKIKKGISKELAKEIVSLIKNSKLKVQAQIMDDQVRVSGKERDDLQAVIQMLKAKDFDTELQFTNYRSS
ncbi:putative nucleotide-binding protein [Oxobacter pfennigii]|uniref:Nucleotide-binding protein OXPF_01140 n=1 Tax=Oxobacter pfennigii TaxID=36849 RepID=A0A0P8YGT0_9CLOT|nr:YajQ family cyclic di-GMP-binding protein [Oxobacter pfennigii]KPU46269.1 putative nucleotide-binding protein [Oxobacter pfennigii]